MANVTFNNKSNYSTLQAMTTSVVGKIYFGTDGGIFVGQNASQGPKKMSNSPEDIMSLTTRIQKLERKTDSCSLYVNPTKVEAGTSISSIVALSTATTTEALSATAQSKLYMKLSTAQSWGSPVVTANSKTLNVSTLSASATSNIKVQYYYNNVDGEFVESSTITVSFVTANGLGVAPNSTAWKQTLLDEVMGVYSIKSLAKNIAGSAVFTGSFTTNSSNPCMYFLIPSSYITSGKTFVVTNTNTGLGIGLDILDDISIKTPVEEESLVYKVFRTDALNPGTYNYKTELK